MGTKGLPAPHPPSLGGASSTALSSPPLARNAGALPANTGESNHNLLDISEPVAPRNHAVLRVLDGAGWHKAREQEKPQNVFLPPCSPELNLIETVFQRLKANRLAARVFHHGVDVVRQGVERAWQFFSERPELIQAITHRAWANLKANSNTSSVT